MNDANNPVRSRSAKKDAARETNGWPSFRAVAHALIAILAAATLIGVLVQRSDSSIASVEAATSVTPEAAPPAPPLDATNAAPEHVLAAAAPRVRTPDTSLVGNHVVESRRTAAVEPPQHPDAIPHADAIGHAKPRLPANSIPNAKLTPLANSTLYAEPKPRVEPLTGADGTNEGAVTISGCLEARDDSFWLKDTSGANAPKSRSWKSAFLKKHAESVRVVDATKALQLSNYVAQRVIATGTLANRTMQARSLERAAGSCH